MIHLFNSKTSKNDLIAFNGEYILDNICSKGTVTEELNGDYSFEGIFRLVDSFPKQAYELLTEDSLLKIDDEYGEEYFRIASVDKTKYEIEVYARHITISDILTMWCEDVRPENQSGNGAINWIFDNAKGINNFQVSSNISEVSTAYYNNKTVYEALFTADNSFLDRWGGEVYRRGFNIAINSKVGADRGVSIRSRKNLLGFEASTNLNELTTRIYPKGFDGITINEKYVDSELINNYARVYSREIKFDDVRVNDDYYFDGFETLEQAQEELKRRCDQQFKINKIDVINATYRIDFVELSKTEEYKDYSIVEKTWIGDTVNVIEESLDIDINVRVIKRQYDVKKKKRINTELSNKDTKIKPPTIGDIVTEINKIPSTDSILQQAKDNATAIINAGMKNSYVVVRKNEILIMDTEDINTAMKIWRYNVNGLGYSNTGYYGTYGTAMTMDGSIVADFITTGVLNANLIKTGILKSFNGKSWINMQDGTFNFYNKLKLDEKGNVIFTGDLNPDSQRINLFGNDCRIDGTADAIRMQLNPQMYISIDKGGYLRFFNAHSNGGENYVSIGYLNDNHTMFFNKTTMLKMLGGSTPQIQCRNTGDNAYVSIAASDFINTSSNKFKTNISDVDLEKFKKILLENNVKEYNLKNDIERLIDELDIRDEVTVDDVEISSADKKIGLILEDLTQEGKELLNPTDTEGIDIYSMVSILWKIVQEQEKDIKILKDK